MSIGEEYMQNIKNEYAEIMHIYNIAQFMDKENYLIDGNESRVIPIIYGLNQAILVIVSIK